jgi:hypothetical protein
MAASFSLPLTAAKMSPKPASRRHCSLQPPAGWLLQLLLLQLMLMLLLLLLLLLLCR